MLLYIHTHTCLANTYVNYKINKKTIVLFHVHVHAVEVYGAQI